MVDKDRPSNSICQFLDRLKFFVAEVLRGETDQQDFDGEYNIADFLPYGHQRRIRTLYQDPTWEIP